MCIYVSKLCLNVFKLGLIVAECVQKIPEKYLYMHMHTVQRQEVKAEGD